MDVILTSTFLTRFSLNEQLVMIRLLLTADEYGMVEFSDRNIARDTGLTHQQVRTIHQKLLQEKVIVNTQSNTATNTKQTFVRFCRCDSYRVFKRLNNTEYNTNCNTIEEFENVWNLYNKKVNRTKELVKKWFSLSTDERRKIFDYIPVYVALTEETYRKQFSTFLNQRTWDNENIYTQGISVPVSSFNAKLVEDQTLFPQFVERFNMMVAGTKIPQVDLKDGLTEKRRVLFNIAYCLHFHKMKQVMQNVINNPRLNGSTGFVADFDYIFKPDNFIRIYEGY
jgi:hypothetical protein